MKHLTSTQPIAGDTIAQIALQHMPGSMKFSLDDQGMLTIVHPESSRPEYSGCILMLKDANIPPGLPASKQVNVPRAGDVLQTYFDRDGRRVFGRTLRRVKQ
ncbi:MAG: hypothetical protein HY597_06155 [Candidatus Omnitrophica bacterium]|nr:hypothetical protein [Candidatus Omnitrophota bacterium]